MAQGLRDHRPLRGRQGHADRRAARARPGARALDLGDDAARRGQGEEDGRDYHFLAARSSTAAPTAKDFLEFATYSGNRYGTLRSEVERRLEAGARWCSRSRSRARARSARRCRRRSRSSSPRPSRRRCGERLEARGTDEPEAIDARLAVAAQELAAQDEFAYRVVNDDIERAAGELEGIVRAASSATLDSPPNDQATSRQAARAHRLALRRGRRRRQARPPDQQLLPRPRRGQLRRVHAADGRHPERQELPHDRPRGARRRARSSTSTAPSARRRAAPGPMATDPARSQRRDRRLQGARARPPGDQGRATASAC